MRKQFICIARGHEGLWEAICLDLDIAVSGETLGAVKAQLNDAIATYIQDAMHEEPSVRDRLLSRRVPFLSRIRWTWPFIISALFGKKNTDETCEFPVLCPA